MTMSPLTELEQRALAMTAEVASLLGKIVADGPTREADLAELVAPLHAIQRSVMAQAVARIFPGRYRLLGGVIEHRLECRYSGLQTHGLQEDCICR